MQPWQQRRECRDASQPINPQCLRSRRSFRMNRYCKHERLGTALLMSGLSLVTTVTHGQENTDMIMLEEVLITARAREEALQNVPISVSTVSGNLIEETGIINLEQLS